MLQRKEISAKTITQSNDASSIGCSHSKIKHAKRHSAKKLRQMLKKYDKLS